MAAEQLNDLVISRICSFLPVSDLKAVRLLNSTWKRGATSSFRQKSRVQLDLVSHKNGIATLEKCMLELAHFGDCLNLGIDICQGYISDLAPFNESCRQFCMDFIQPGIISLTLKNDAWDEELEMSHLIEDILHHFSHNLESWNLALEFGEVPCAGLLQLRQGNNFTFPKLKMFEDSALRFYYDRHEDPDEMTLFYSKFFTPQAVPNLEIVKMWEPHYFFRRLAQEPNSLPKLTSLEIVGPVGEEELELITRPSWTLTSLKLQLRRYKPYTLAELINKVCPTLEHLTLDGVDGSIVFPSCPNLKTLSLLFCVIEHWQDGRSWFDIPHPGLDFNADEVTDRGYFPVLEVLTLKIFNHNGVMVDFEEIPDCLVHLRQLFPEGGDDFQSLRTLMVPIGWEVGEQDMRARLPARVQIIYIPNVVDEE